MTTEYYQIPSQQGLLPLDSAPDPWLASATTTLSSLSLYDNTWGVKSKLAPSLFDQGEEESAWNHIVSMHTVGTQQSSNKTKEVKAPIVPKQFHSTTSQIDAWSVSVVDNIMVNSPKTHKRNTSTNSNSSLPSTSDAKPVIEDELSGQNRYKTELCKSFTETGQCRYGTKCQFAHGKEEIRPILRHPKYKTEICKTFHTTGTCPYGIRCRFIHTRSKEESMMANVKVPTVPVIEEEEDVDDGVISLTHPPGIPVPQWSKSWNVAIGSPAVSHKARGTA